MREISNIPPKEITAKIDKYSDDVQRYIIPVIADLTKDPEIARERESFLEIMIVAAECAFHTTFVVESDYAPNGLGLNSLTKEKYSVPAVKNFLARLSCCPSCYSLVDTHITEFVRDHPQFA